MVSVDDGSAFTGTVTVYITGDGGSQAIGTVGSGICTHEGNGLHTYQPSQAETNYTHIAFTFVGSGAVPVTIQVYTNVDTQLLDIQSRLPATLDAGNMRSSVQTMAANTLTAQALATDAVTEIQSGLATSTEIQDVPTVAEFNARTIAAADYATSTALAAVAQYLDTEIQDILTDTGTTLPAQITSAFTEIKGAGWTSTTDTLEKIAESAGGGSTSIMVTPVVAQTPVRVVGSNISTFIGDLSTIRIGVFSGSDPVDLTAFGDLEVCVQQKNGTDLDFVEMADLTIDGDDDNYISWEPSGPSVVDVTRGKWSLRKASNKQVIAYGAWIVEDAALEDVGS